MPNFPMMNFPMMNFPMMNFPVMDFPVICFLRRTVRRYPAGRRASHRHPTSIPRKAPTEFRLSPGCWPSANWDSAPAI
jgi:hypothetical protein